MLARTILWALGGLCGALATLGAMASDDAGLAWGLCGASAACILLAEAPVLLSGTKPLARA